ncbi:MAG: zinc ABC transporter solute-binding protein [Phycisphaerales bacterium]|nr:zinc ABC transporter solute-binding protein [Phycisphaerales bacterium]
MNQTRTRPLLAAGLLGSIIFALAGCDRAPASAGSAPAPHAGDGPYRIVCTVGMIADIVRAIAGDRAEVVNLIGEGVDPHLYLASRNDVVQLMNADVIFYNGLMLEGKMTDVLIKAARTGKPVHAVTEMLDDDRYVMNTEQQHFDPHVWMDPRGWMKAVDAVALALADFDPPYAEMYVSNAMRYRAELERLDAYAREAFASVPEPQRVLVTAHDAFGYLGRAYDVTVRGIQGISTESDAGVRDVNELIDFIVTRRIPAVFVETSVTAENVEALVEGARHRGHEVVIGGSLFSDAMGRAGTYEGTYIGMIDHNVTTIVRALGGSAPPGGMQGRLAEPAS